ncbi:chain length determinant protein EpsF [Aromatoleum bremense]|uniref:Chain length determinant protein EpsF n=1 Tax=Aromatoleum bremense TaxID=76115 RepID=A0ABX1NQ54_9RHOO|nr:chain length determinant protein EpsF [Aromatoleum bremense]NMG14113.1 chain length determinant protein EpsF [Aromatoleum bremense]QTQ33889.1 Chain length determinant protein [Aromatoleum bremense]
MTIRQIFVILRARSRLILAVFIAVVALGAVVAVILPRNYTANVALVIDAKSANALLGQMLSSQMLGGYMATQVDIIGSRRVVERAAAAPEVADDEALRAAWRAETGEEVAFPLWLADEIESNLDVQPSRDSNVVQIAYTCAVAEQCANVANAVANAYIATNLEMKVQPARQYAQWFESRNSSLRETVEAARRRLSDYQREHGIVTTDERLDVETARLDELSRQLVAAQSDRSDSRSRRNQSGSGEMLPEVVQSSLLASLKGELARLEAQRDQATARLGPRHPEIVRADREIASLQRRIALETSRIVGSIDTTDRVNAGRVAEMRQAVDEQKAKVLKLKAQRDQIAVLQKDLDSAQQAYDVVNGRLAETNLESQAQQTNVFVLASAAPPRLPSSPRRALIVALAAVLGALLGVSLALGLEMVRRRVRSASDVVDVLGIPVLGALPRAKNTLLLR